MTAAAPATFAALADGTRRAVIEALARGPLSAGELATRLDVSPALLTRHLRVLRDARIVTVNLDADDNRRHVYELRTEPLVGVRDWADEVASFWSGQLAAFTAHVTKEKRARARR